MRRDLSWISRSKLLRMFSHQSEGRIIVSCFSETEGTGGSNRVSCYLGHEHPSPHIYPSSLICTPLGLITLFQTSGDVWTASFSQFLHGLLYFVLKYYFQVNPYKLKDIEKKDKSPVSAGSNSRMISKFKYDYCTK